MRCFAIAPTPLAARSALSCLASENITSPPCSAVTGPSMLLKTGALGMATSAEQVAQVTGTVQGDPMGTLYDQYISACSSFRIPRKQVSNQFDDSNSAPIHD